MIASRSIPKRRSMSGRHAIMLSCLLAALALRCAAARADCPLLSQIRTCMVPSTTGYQDWTFSFSSPADRESTDACYTCALPGVQCEGYDPGPSEVVQVDIPAGVVYARITTGGSGTFYRPIGAISQDQYWIMGPATTGSIACTARFEVGGYGACPSAGTASMTVQSNTVSTTYDNGITQGPCNQPPPLSGGLTSPVSSQVGEPFAVTLSAQITNPPAYGGRAYLYGRLSFRDLPPGYSVVSCNGFGSLATRVVQRSWGGVKTIYR